ncbi:hypothetical protein F2Q68_00039106 [Brassica cretica]|uniref:Leucine-rich repeat-containing N-terminal plant-type domain-containing protein n=1 Tax=Brassica cretica TaxID=69181 RepID=A0A8S9ME82_BRACR|nr:hypothetical protein F2Q68_00039106 [Brassica cretica]
MIIWSLCFLFSLSDLILVFASSAKHLCPPDQRDTLWEFKSEFSVQELDSSWWESDLKTERWRNNTDCCSWDGISCDSKTGTVVELDLWGSSLNGPLRSNSSLFRLEHLQSLNLSSNNLPGILPYSIGNLKYLRVLKLRYCNFFGKIPSSLGNLSYLTDLDLSVNQFSGELPDSMGNLNRLSELQLRYNNLGGNFPSVLLNLSELTQISLSYNKFKEIPRTICDLVYLDRLVLSNNNFSGSIPPCLSTYLSVLHLRNNSISSVIPEDFISNMLISLDLGYNRLSGGQPKSLINCTRLQFLNVEENIISDTFPFWLRVLPNLEILVLRSNEFHGPISSFSLPKLRIFDISRNKFTGVLQSDFFAGWGAMSLPVVYFQGDSQYRFSGVGKPYYHASVALTNKGSNMKLVGSGFTIYKTIDISGNRFQGGIPESIGLLKELIVLYMSNNAFTGRIPPSLSNITSLQSLDLSQNQLSGKIPPEIGKLTFLAWMNFSYNRLEGPIPQGTQIQSQNISSFAENPELCGVPLQKTCGGGEGAINQEQEDEDEEKDQVLSWTAAAIAYLPSVFCGFTLGHILTSYRHDWFMRI